MTVTILTGDCRELLATLPDGSCHTCVTSPPYFGLRDYGTASWSGGDADCDHAKPATQGATGQRADRTNHSTDGSASFFRDVCGKCGATRQDRQIGLEATVDAYVGELVAVFREVRRVLRDDGTLWLNLGDSYANQKTGDTYSGFNARWSGTGLDGGKQAKTFQGVDKSRKFDFGYLKPKDLMGIPWRVAFALQADGWWLRSDIIWHKPNPIPESVTDRPTKAHEYIFLLSKSAKYYYDAAAIAEPAVTNIPNRQGERGTQGYAKASGGAKHNPQRAHVGGYGYRISKDSELTRNLRTVWTIPTKPFREAHFATFPPDLIEPCIKAGSRVGGVVLDPFGGAGTTGLVADRLNRNAVLVELNPDYAEMARRRISGDAPLFAEVS